MTAVGSRDLSEVFDSVHVTIEGIGSFGSMGVESLAHHVATVAVVLTGKPLFCYPGDAPWEVVSFDREAKKLVVRPVPDLPRSQSQDCPCTQADLD